MKQIFMCYYGNLQTQVYSWFGKNTDCGARPPDFNLGTLSTNLSKLFTLSVCFLICKIRAVPPYTSDGVRIN